MIFSKLSLFYLCATIAGLLMGNMSSAFASRWIEELPIYKPFRSFCLFCGKQLAWYDTLPVINCLWLQGKCRHCGKLFGIKYVFLECTCFIWPLLMLWRYGPTIECISYSLLGCLLITTSFIDFETLLLPDRISLGGLFFALCMSLFLPLPSWQDSIAGSLAGGGSFWLLLHAYRLLKNKEGLGVGDIKLMCMIGAITGLSGLPFVLLVGFMLGAVGSGVCLLFSSEGLKTRIPFGPFLSFACLLWTVCRTSNPLWWCG